MLPVKIYAFLILLVANAIGISTSAAAENSTRLVTDQLGRTIRVPAEPLRVVSLAPSVTEIIFALNKEHLLKGVTRFSDFPPQAAKLPKVGTYVHLDIEKIVALEPDLCIAVKDGNPIEVVRRLESLGIPVYAVDPKDLNGVMDTLKELGRLLGATEQARDRVQEMQARIQQVRSLVQEAAHRPKVFFQIGISPIVSVGTPTFIHELIVLAGGKNLAEGPTPYPRFSREQVLALSPEVFFITSMARGEVFERVKAEWSRWHDLPAVRNDRIFLVDSNIFDRPGPRLLDALELLVQQIHPELFQGLP